jgi:hypothetical protein
VAADVLAIIKCKCQKLNKRHNVLNAGKNRNMGRKIFHNFLHRKVLHEIRKRKANWIGHMLRRNCLLKEVIVGKIKGRIEVTRRRGRRRNKLLDDLGDRRGYSYLKEEALDRIKWRNRFGRGFGPIV